MKDLPPLIVPKKSVTVPSTIDSEKSVEGSLNADMAAQISNTYRKSGQLLNVRVVTTTVVESF